MKSTCSSSLPSSYNRRRRTDAGIPFGAVTVAATTVEVIRWNTTNK